MRALGVPLADAVQACACLQPGAPVACSRSRWQGQPLVLVDYAHTPDALEKALHALRPAGARARRALWCVFGCGGDRDASQAPADGRRGRARPSTWW